MCSCVQLVPGPGRRAHHAEAFADLFEHQACCVFAFDLPRDRRTTSAPRDLPMAMIVSGTAPSANLGGHVDAAQTTGERRDFAYPFHQNIIEPVARSVALCVGSVRRIFGHR
jgi:hypothetical protein